MALDPKRDIDAQAITEEEQMWLTDYLERIDDGRLLVNFPEVVFGVKIKDFKNQPKAEKDKMRVLRTKVRDKIVLASPVPIPPFDKRLREDR